VDLLVLDLRFRNMWYIIFKFRKYLNSETLEMFKYMHGTLFFKCYRKYLNLRKYLKIGERKYIEKLWYVIFKFRKYLNCETLEMFKYMHGTTFFNVIENI
jgi:hypothetical protein